MINVIADRYAQALFEVGEETQTTSELYQELSELVKILNENNDFYNKRKRTTFFVVLLRLCVFALRQNLFQLFGCNCFLFAGYHVFQGNGIVCHLLLADDGYVGYAVAVGIAHLFLHLVAAGEQLCRDACLTQVAYNGKRVQCFLLAEVHEHHLCGVYGILGVEVELVHHVIYAVGTE